MDLRCRLVARRAELEEATLDRVFSINDPAQTGEGDYLTGLRAAVGAALDYGFLILDGAPSGTLPPVPSQLLAQARLAARTGVSLDAVLRRYVAGHSQFSDLLLEEAETAVGSRAELKQLFRCLAAGLDQLIGAASAEYARELAERQRSTQRRRLDLIRDLLAGELRSTAELRYDLDVWHLGMIATGQEDVPAIRELATTLDRVFLQVPVGTDVSWIWLGGRRPFESEELAETRAGLESRLQAPISLGEPAQGPRGWRLTHRQAVAILPIARRGERLIVRYAEDPLLASALQDELLAGSLRELYLAPLARERDRGAAARETLRGYFAAGGNTTSAAAALGVSRRTVRSRISVIEDRLGQSLASISAELQTALRLDEIEASPIRADPP